jgi:hypothetical protein
MMKKSQTTFLLLVSVLLILSFSERAPAVLFYSTDDPAHNTMAPAGDLAGSGWQFQGRFGSFLGTPVAPRFFITARHIGGNVGDKFTWRGSEFTTIARFDDPNSDLRLWQTCETFPEHAELYSGSLEVNQPVIVFGRGTRRGEEVQITTAVRQELKGWRWGAADGLLRWGENRVASIVRGDDLPLVSGGSNRLGDLLQCRFNANGGPNEAHLSNGDSGGGLFLNDGGVWKLAGINYAVDGPYNTSNTGPGFHAAIFDEGGLYKGGSGNWAQVINLPVDLPGAFYATRISSNLEWIESVLNGPLAADPPPRLQSSDAPHGPFANHPGAAVNPAAQTIAVPRTSDAQFFRLRACGPVSIRSMQMKEEHIVIEYQQ